MMEVLSKVFCGRDHRRRPYSATADIHADSDLSLAALPRPQRFQQQLFVHTRRPPVWMFLGIYVVEIVKFLSL